jgi:hypothetical protein
MSKISENKKGFGGVELFVVVVLVVLLGATGWLVYKREHKTLPLSGASTLQTVTNPYATWKSYTDSKVNFSSIAGFSIKYPSNFTSNDTNKPTQYMFTSSDYKEDGNSPPPYIVSGSVINVSFDPLPTNQSLKDYVSSQGATDNGMTATTLSGLSAYSTSSTTNPKTLKYYSTYTAKDNVVITVSLSTVYSTSGSKLSTLVTDYNYAVSTLVLNYGKETTLTQ